MDYLFWLVLLLLLTFIFALAQAFIKDDEEQRRDNDRNM